ncbi:MAG TPA: lytic polysaccharide monooxygenase, partial [Rugosimonospora sp.]|nr:lytic polysaccharide monooxygenase [Rugosimonospora sp.]
MLWSSAARRTLAAVVVLAAAWLMLPTSPGYAHGATSSPISRAVACGPEGGTAARSAACKAADAISGAAAFNEFDNIRVPNVNGRDVQRIPDGKLCSGGLAKFKGLDLARADWPATTLTAGAMFTFRYRVTIPHSGSFRFYVTRDGYRPTRPLRWADLETKPFLTTANPPIQDGAYVMKGRLPAGKSGRQLIYAIWQTTSTVDTYYSCSDVIFTASAASGPAVAPAPGSAEPAGADAPGMSAD